MIHREAVCVIYSHVSNKLNLVALRETDCMSGKGDKTNAKEVWLDI